MLKEISFYFVEKLPFLKEIILNYVSIIWSMTYYISLKNFQTLFLIKFLYFIHKIIEMKKRIKIVNCHLNVRVFMMTVNNMLSCSSHIQYKYSVKCLTSFKAVIISKLITFYHISEGISSRVKFVDVVIFIIEYRVGFSVLYKTVQFSQRWAFRLIFGQMKRKSNTRENHWLKLNFY